MPNQNAQAGLPAVETGPAEGPPPPTPRTKAAFALAFAFAAVLVLYWARSSVFLTFSGLLIGILVSFVADGIHRWTRVPRGAAVTVVTVLFFAAAALMVALLAIPIVDQLSKLLDELPHYAQMLQQKLAEFREDHAALASLIPENPAAGLGDKATHFASTAVTTALASFEALVELVTVFFLALFFAMDPDRYIRGVADLLPGAPEPRIWLMYRMGKALRAWMIATGIEMLLVAGMWALGLWLFRVPYWILFGVIGGFVEIVPYYGPILAMIPPLLISLTMGPGATFAVLVIYLVIHVIDSYIILPYLLDRQVNLPPVAVLVAISALGSAFGVWGIVLSMPILTVAYVYVNQVYLRPAEHAAETAEPPPVVPEAERPGDAEGETAPAPA